MLLEGNLHIMFMVLMSLCDMSEYPKLLKRLDSLGLLSIIKKLVYTGITKDFDVRHNKATTLLNLMNLHQEKFQSIQDFRDQHLVMKKVCDELELSIGRCESNARAMLKKKNLTYPTDAQLSKAVDKIVEELHAIIFKYKAARHKYGNILDQMENDILQKKEPFPKTVSKASTLMEGWKSKPGNFTSISRLKQTTILPLQQMENKKKPAIITRKKKSHVLNVEKKGITLTNATKNSQKTKKWNF